METKEKGYQLGILGGMGPKATAQLYNRIIDKVPANCDQEHLEMVILNKCSIPDRTEALLYGKESPIEKLNEGILELIKLNCKYFIIPCNTAHAYKKDFKNLDKIIFIDMIEESIKKLKETNEDFYVLCTNGTRKVDVYKEDFFKYPDLNLQDSIMQIVTDTKAGIDCYERLNQIINKIDGNILLACTELSLYYDKLKQNNKHLIYDSMEILIDKVIEKCQR